MKIQGIIWLDDIIDKLATKHNVRQNEVLEVFSNQPYFRFVEKGHRSEKMCMPHWGRLKMVDILLFSLFIRKTDEQSYFQQEI